MFQDIPQRWFPRLRTGVLVVTTVAIVLAFSTLTLAVTHTGNGVPLLASTGAPVAAYPQVDGTVNAAVSDGSGGWYVGGSFTTVGGVAQKYLAHILSTGTLDSSWNPNLNDAVYTLAFDGNTLYVGGWFTRIDGQVRTTSCCLM